MADTKLVDLPDGTLDPGSIVYAVNNPSGAAADVKVTAENLKIGLRSVALLGIGYDGDSFVRTTVTDSTVTASSRIFCSVQRDVASDGNDKGLLYTVNVVSVASGSFDVLVGVQAWGQDDPTPVLTGEDIYLVYLVG